MRRRRVVEATHPGRFKEDKKMQGTKYGVITGASSGIGCEFAKRLAREGYSLVLVARRTAKLEELAQRLGKENPDIECRVFRADLSTREGCYALADFLADIPVEVFINNAGYGDCGFFPEGDMEKELGMIDLNVTAVHILTKLMLRKMQNQEEGYILNVASSAGLIPAGPYMATYYATKAYVASLSRAVAEELRQRKSPIYVGCLCPGPVDTEFNDVANVRFALKGISARKCADYAITKMFRKKRVIVPTWKMKLVVTCGRFIPQGLYIWLAAHQQKKKI